jgi:hypothetical protein
MITSYKRPIESGEQLFHERLEAALAFREMAFRRLRFECRGFL